MKKVLITGAGMGFGHGAAMRLAEKVAIASKLRSHIGIGGLSHE
jgi:NAD(P)-dependent dehydrogenase (short-subunit alcohol dehydrogenase family)